jgi:2-hydroxy-3-keto-5-methylthiopentenyl-1-phosphate phosphatase
MTFKVNLSVRKLKALIKDEEKASKEYKSYGFKSLAKDESKHAKFLKQKLDIEEYVEPRLEYFKGEEWRGRIFTG